MPPVHKQKAFLPLTSRRRGTRQSARGKEMLPQYEFQMTLIAPYKGLDARIFRQVAKDLRCRIKFMDLAFDEAIEAAKRLSPDTCDVVLSRGVTVDVVVTRQTVLCTTPFSFGMRKLEESILWHTVCINRKRGVCSRRSVYAASPRSG